MHRSVAFVLSLAGCSFVLVHAPPATYDPKTVTCTDSDVVPSVDSAAGVLAIATAVGGEFVTQLTDHKLEHYELVMGLPLVVAGIIYFVSAHHGTDAVQRCTAIKQGETDDCDGCPAGVP